MERNDLVKQQQKQKSTFRFTSWNMFKCLSRMFYRKDGALIRTNNKI